MQIKQPSFPLTPVTFAAALSKGHGRARQQIDSYGPDGLEDLIVGACVSCLSYDPQCEAARAPWLSLIVDRANLTAQVIEAIEAIIQKPQPENHRDMDQRSALLKEFAAAGSDDARRLLYLSLVRLPHTSDVIGAEQIVALDGLDGLMHVARQLGRWLEADPDFWVDEYLSTQFDESTGIEGGLATLEREAANDADIASYLAGMRKTLNSRSNSPSRRDPTSYADAEIVALATKNSKDQCHWFRLWGANATIDQRETVFAALLATDEPEHVKRLFRCFAKIGVPRFDGRLLQWTTHSDKQIQWAAAKALTPLKDIKLRRAAIQMIADGALANGFTLLINNFAPGDFGFCTKHLKRFEDEDETHHLAGQLLDLCEAHPSADALDCLLYAYEFSPCSTCRSRAVKALIDTNIAPTWVLSESAFDADPDTQALISNGRSVDRN